MNGHPARHLAHGDEQGKRIVRQLHGFIGNANDFSFQQGESQFLDRSQVQIGVQNLPFPEERQLFSKRFFHFHNHFRPAENFIPVGDFCALLFVMPICKPAPQPGLVFHQNFVAQSHKVVNPCGRDGNAAFVRFYFFRNTDDHIFVSLICR